MSPHAASPGTELPARTGHPGDDGHHRGDGPTAAAVRSERTERLVPSDGLEVFGAVEFLDALRACTRVLEDHAPWLDSMDQGVAPPGAELASGTAGSPSSDDRPPAAGSDMAATLASAVMDAEDSRDFTTLANGLRGGARRGAVGRPGRRLATFVTGLVEVLTNADRLDGLRMALALEAGAEALTAGDDGSHPGGFPTVAAVAADGALAAADDGAGLAEVLVSAADSGLEELLQGPQVDDVLAERGTVDADAAGFLLIIDSLASVVTGEPLPVVPAAGQQHMTDVVVAGTSYTYEVRCDVHPHEGPSIEAADDLEAVLRELGTLADFDGLGGVWKVRLHTPLPGTAVEAVCGVGRPTELRIAVLDDLG